MTNIYVRSTDGNNSSSGFTWVDARATVAGASLIDVAGDSIYVSSNHAESTASSVSISLAGTVVSPTRVICVLDNAEPPTAVSTTATVSTTGSGAITFSGAAFYVYGLRINAGVGITASVSINLNNTVGARAAYEDCAFAFSATGAGSRLEVVSAAGQLTTFEGCAISFASTSQRLYVNHAGTFLWNGGAIDSVSSAITGLFGAGASGSRAIVSGVDLSRGAATMNLFTAGISGVFGLIRNCRMPASWSGSLTTGTLAMSERYEMYNCDSTDTNYRLWIAAYCGSIKSETTVVRAGGASDGATPLSWAMTSNDNAKSPLLFTLASPEIVRWNDTTGSAITVTIEIVSNEPLDNKQCWIEVQYLGTAGYPLGSLISSAPANLLGLSTALASSSEEWATAGITGPWRQKISVTFTPQERGYVHAVVRLAEPNTKVYVDPLLTIT